jgi:hypothetical protein
MPLDNELLMALQMYSKGVQDLSLARTLNSANDAVAQIKAAEGSEQQKRAQLQDLSNNLVRQLGAIGVEPSKIAQQADAVSHQFRSPGEAAIQGTLTGNQGLVDAAQQADIAGQAGNIAQTRVQLMGQMALQDKKFGQAVALQQAKGTKGSNADIEFTSNVQSALVNLQKLEKTVKKKGNFEAIDTDAASIIDQASYDLAIAYAKIVDPASVAREGEVATAQKYMLKMGMMTRNKRTLSDIKAFRQKIMERVKARTLAKKSGGMDPFDQHLGAGGVADATTSPDESNDDLAQFVLGE